MGVEPPNYEWFVSAESSSDYFPKTLQTIQGSHLQLEGGQWATNITSGLIPFKVTAAQPIQADYFYRVWLAELQHANTLILGARKDISDGLFNPNDGQFAYLRFNDQVIVFYGSVINDYSGDKQLSFAGSDYIEIEFNLNEVKIRTSSGDSITQKLTINPAMFYLHLSETKADANHTQLYIEKKPNKGLLS